MTRTKRGKFSEVKCFAAKIPLWGWKGYLCQQSVSEGSHACAHITLVTLWFVLNNASNCRLEIQDGIYINLEMYQITVICSVKHFTCYIDGELHMKSILCDAQLLTIIDKRAQLSAKCPTL